MRHLSGQIYLLIMLITAAVLTGCHARNPWAGTDDDVQEAVTASEDVSVDVMTVVRSETNEDDSTDINDPALTSDPYAADAPQPERMSPEEAGIHEECLDLITDIIETDIENGFSSAQLAIMRDGKLVYENAWGRVNSYHPDGTRDEESPFVTSDTLYDLASITKMFGVNYALQRLVTEGRINLDDRVSDYLGDRFYEDVTELHYEKGEESDIETQKKWKKEITLRDLITHKGGFPADPHYCHQYYDAEKQELSTEVPNALYAGCGADLKTKEDTIEAICKTPLLYEPGKKILYSDVDFMLLGVIAEQITGMDLDTYLKETFCYPMGLRNITYKPLEHGFEPSDCAATELNGNTRDGAVYFDGIRTYTLQGEVHDENAYYCMGGISGHAGLFGSATDLARLADVMLTGKHGDTEYFSEEVIEMFTGPESSANRQWGLGWWRQGDSQRSKYFGSKAGEATFGHQGWTGTLIMIDPEKKIVIAYLTNKINTPVTDIKNPNEFNGSRYTSASLGFVPEIVYTGLDEDIDVSVLLEEEGYK